MRTSKSELLEKLKALDVEVLATVGAGDIDTFVNPIKKLITDKYAI
jgi:UDP-N-acetylmuramate--alanine ligase